MAESERSAQPEQQKYDEEEYGLYPYDVLIMKWLPDTDPLSLDKFTGSGSIQDSNLPRLWSTLLDARRRELDASSLDEVSLTPAKPWPLPPLRPRSQLEPGVEE
ncbi:hypothetical protein A1F94_008004 [Pyrenophora tritici-repentis]|uniref:Uncharacterized protein n=2 Tax=Pyrenophora tritici-repentis TaxID=45151 RepID=A0A2W1HMX2_9PLEO|nr:uncharacterized protein PTRG_09746 [Pyrenophora tritici-repentis Pt-1C-BFP]KAF7451106.1 hypothetical protein A1F99_057220 [Pyrenophora tritici-repentis]EDU42797.1 predicted protein [Pyrenophora tritici-repentis Pt-1C-BFP]KAF7573790.1 hypothetical protein PtrM4_086950 [Pyrenophora tritici-repentis]KAG9380684.1 hypothetical protein A1F94_008004 [Pyrenophora tritici-repentis]KAI1515941.1 hypothetical protein Ptr86124_004478 [Pyrenophora tritici-repentis]